MNTTESPIKKLSIYIDGGARGNPGPSGIGVAIYNNEATPIEMRYKFLGIETNNRAEAIGAKYGIQRGIELGATEIVLYMDSLIIAEQLNGRFKISNKGLREIHLAIQGLLTDWNGKLSVYHIRREFNQEADRLSNKAMDEGSGPRRVYDWVNKCYLD